MPALLGAAAEAGALTARLEESAGAGLAALSSGRVSAMTELPASLGSRE